MYSITNQTSFYNQFSRNSLNEEKNSFPINAVNSNNQVIIKLQSNNKLFTCGLKIAHLEKSVADLLRDELNSKNLTAQLDKNFLEKLEKITDQVEAQSQQLDNIIKDDETNARNKRQANMLKGYLSDLKKHISTLKEIETNDSGKQVIYRKIYLDLAGKVFSSLKYGFLGSNFSEMLKFNNQTITETNSADSQKSSHIALTQIRKQLIALVTKKENGNSEFSEELNNILNAIKNSPAIKKALESGNLEYGKRMVVAIQQIAYFLKNLNLDESQKTNDVIKDLINIETIYDKLSVKRVIGDLNSFNKTSLEPDEGVVI